MFPVCQRLIATEFSAPPIAPVREDAIRSRLSDVLGYLHVINAATYALVNCSTDPNLHHDEQGRKIQEYRLKAHEAICEILDEFAPAPQDGETRENSNVNDH